MPLHCDRCRTALPETCFNTPMPVACPGCQAPLLARVFPAFFRAPTVGRAAETVASDEDASCFFHPRKKAIVPCERCGRFLCALCDLDLGGRHLCPACVADGTMAASAPGVELANERFLYDRMALTLAALPLLFLWPVTLFTAPVALFYAVRHWNDFARGWVPRRRSTVVLAALLALLEIAAWGVAGYYGVFLARADIFPHGPVRGTLAPLPMPPPDDPPAVRPTFRRLPGRVPRLTPGLVRRQSALWLSEEELVQVDTVFWQEKTRRYAYADIQAVLLCETPRGLVYSVVLGGLAALCGSLAWGMEAPGARAFLAGVAAFLVLLLIYNAARGGTCRCVLQTALGLHPLPSLARRRPARRALRLITERVEARQGAV